MRTDLFGRTFECSCGKTHRIGPKEILYSDDAIARLPELMARYAAGRRAAVLMDARTKAAAGEAAAEALRAAGWRPAAVVVPDPGAAQNAHAGEGAWPVCDEATQRFVGQAIGETDSILAVGSGVVSDLGKWTAFERRLPFFAFATAASMNGYASANVAPTLQGVKTLIHAAPAVAVASSGAVLSDAPYEMTAAGLGDVLAKTASSADWRMNQILFGDEYCERSVGLIDDIEPIYLDKSEDLLARKPAAIEALFEALLLTGVAMTMAETSAPASGGEHLISHALDMMSSLDGVAHDLHGRQVGLATVLTSELYRRAMAIESPRFVDSPVEINKTFWERLSDVVAGQYGEKIKRLKAARAALSQGNAWDSLRATLAPMVRPPETTQGCLRKAGAAWRAEDIGCSRTRLIEAFLHAHEMRSRFTILDLAWMLGILPAAAHDIVRQWA